MQFCLRFLLPGEYSDFKANFAPLRHIHQCNDIILKRIVLIVARFSWPEYSNIAMNYQDRSAKADSIPVIYYSNVSEVDTKEYKIKMTASYFQSRS